MAQVSSVDAVIAALLTTLDTALDCPVYDGLEPTSASDPDCVLVGDDGDPDALTNEPAAEVTQEWAAFELGSRDEEGTVTCAVISQSGDNDLAARRVASKAIMVSIETALRASETLGGVVAVGGIDTVRLYQSRNSQGSVARRTFTFRYRAFQG